MGIDIYAKWRKMTKAEEKAQYKGFTIDIDNGSAGYLREAYHGEPYATQFFVKEAFDGEAKIPADVLVSRLPETVRILVERAKKVYEWDGSNIEQTKWLAAEIESYASFARLCAEKEEKFGEPTEIIASY